MKNMIKISTSVIMGVLFIQTAYSQNQQELEPNKGYTQRQAMEIFSRFDQATWSLENDPSLTRFAYINTPQFFKHALIHRAGPISELKYEDDPSIGKISAETHAGKMTLDEWTANHLDACIVMLEGKIIYEKYPKMRSFDKHIWWSMSKSIAGTLVGLLEVQGLVNVNKSIETYIPDLEHTEWKGTSVIDILDMASGMTGLEADDPEAYTNPESAYALFEGSIGAQAITPKTMKSTYEYIKTLKRQKPSGEKCEYTSVNTFVLSWLIEEVTGKPYAEVISETFWRNMGAESDGLVAVSPVGAAGAHGYIYSTLRDVARYGTLFTKSWNEVANKQVVPSSLIERIQQEGRSKLYIGSKSETYWDAYMGEECLFQTRQFDFVTEDGDFGKSGYHGQTLYISPSKGLVVVSFATIEKYDTFKFARKIAQSLK